jgi:hypothetical protein
MSLKQQVREPLSKLQALWEKLNHNRKNSKINLISNSLLKATMSVAVLTSWLKKPRKAEDDRRWVCKIPMWHGGGGLTAAAGSTTLSTAAPIRVEGVRGRRKAIRTGGRGGRRLGSSIVGHKIYRGTRAPWKPNDHPRTYRIPMWRGGGGLTAAGGSTTLSTAVTIRVEGVQGRRKANRTGGRGGRRIALATPEELRQVGHKGWPRGELGYRIVWPRGKWGSGPNPVFLERGFGWSIYAKSILCINRRLK